MPSRSWFGSVFGGGRRPSAARPRRERADWYVPLEIGRLEERRVLNVAPIINGAGNLTTVHQNQPAATISGDKVSALIAGHVTDPDPGALSGIAVTAVDNSHGKWQFSTDSGAHWTDFGAPTDANARLLAADVSTYIRFIPGPDFNGTVSPGITFRAWDQTSGTAGATADTTSNGGTTAFSATTAHSDITVDEPITITGTHGTSIGDNQTANPFTGVTISDTISAAEAITVTVTQSATANGHLSNLGGFVDNLDGTYTFTGNAGDATTALDGLLFTPTANQVAPGSPPVDTSFTILAADAVTSTTDSNTVVHVTSINDAPTLDNTKTQPFTTINEDALNNPGNTVASLLGMAQGDVDPGAVQGIAITATSITLEPGDVVGTKAWQYSTDGGMNWINVGAVSDSQALLLRPTDLVRFLPDAQNGNTGSITYRAWDQTSGTAGTKVDASTNGATTAFSTATGSSNISVTDVNDAPLLDPAKTQPLAMITEDNTDNISNPGSTVAQLLGMAQSDVDLNAVQGIAITATSITPEPGDVVGTKVWQYSTDGGTTWNPIVGVSDTQALLLAPTDRVRFLPDGKNGNTGSITYRAWDQTSGSHGTQVDVSTNGGTTAYSTATASSAITVTDVNDAPVLDNTKTQPFTTITEDAQNNPGNTVASLLGMAQSDVDLGAVQGIAITATSITLENGDVLGTKAWQYSTDGGANWLDIGAVSDTQALLLRSTDLVRFLPDAKNGNTGSITYRAWDQTGASAGQQGTKVDVSTNGGTSPYSTATASSAITVTDVNDAPTLDNTKTQPFTTITEDAQNNAGNTVASLLGMAQGDVDLGAVQGIAITATSITLENGDVLGTKAWQYSIDGGANWLDIGAVSDSQALLLRSTDLVRFLPDAKNGNTGSITYRAWDQTGASAGQQGTKVDVSTNGGTTPYSTATASSGITVTDVNDAPVLDNTKTQPFTTITEDAQNNPGNTVASLLGMAQSDVDLGAVQGIAITATSITLENGDVLGTKAWQYSIDGGTNWLDVGTVTDSQALLLRSTDLVRFLPDAKNGNTGSITYRAWDQTGPSAGQQGTKVDVSANGGTTPYSTATASSAITVTDVNDAPVLDNTKTQPFTTITEDAQNNPGNTVASLLGMAQSDVDLGAVQGIAITATSITLENGDVLGTKAWQYSIDGGANWLDIGAVSETQALLLRSTDLVRFLPDAKNGNTGSITYRAWDQTGSSAGQQGTKVDVSTNGGTTPYSTATASSAITVTDVNDAPVLDNTKTQPFTTITEDAQNNPGNTVASLLDLAQSDVDLNAVQGIAITATSITLENGDVLGTKAWQYSTDGGMTWLDVGAVSDSQALLLRSTDLVRFLPDAKNGNTGSITYRAWDQSSGAAGTKVDVSTNGGTTAYSTTTASSAITVTDVNDAPTLDNTKTQPLTTITEDDLNNPGNTVASLLGMAQSDVDLGAVQGIAITATSITLENGDVLGTKAWQYSIDGGANWLDIGAVSDSQALLLRSTDLVRFLPDAKNGNTGSITFRAWDQTGSSAGQQGTKVDISTNGGTTPYSTATASSAITVTDVNDAPVLDNTKTQPFTTITEDAQNNPGNTVASLLGMAQSDVDLGAVQGIAITATSITLENGDVLGTKAWQYSTDGGATWLDIGAVSDTQALLLRSTDLVRFLPDAKNGNTGSITYRAWDQTGASAGQQGTKVDVSTNGGTTPYSTDIASSAITVTDVNDAPVLDNTNTQPFTTITEDDLNNPGNTVASLLGSAQSDVDLNAVQGIAITATSITLESGDVLGTKAWQYSTDGGTTWLDIGIVSDSQALLLRSTDLVRFLPDAKNGNTGSITYRAWDQTGSSAGQQGTKVDVSSNGGTTAYSTATASSAITVTDVNDAPVLDNTKTQLTFTTITEDDITNSGSTVASLLQSAVSDVDLNAVQGIAVTATTVTGFGEGNWQYSLDGGTTWNDIGAVSSSSALLLRPQDVVRFLPDAKNGDTGTITFQAWDQSGATAGKQGTKVDVSSNGGITPFSSASSLTAITVLDVNDAPTLTPQTIFLPVTVDTSMVVDGIPETLGSFGIVNGSPVGSLPASSVDRPIVPFAWTIVSGNNGTFTIDPTTGAVSVADATLFTFTPSKFDVNLSATENEFNSPVSPPATNSANVTIVPWMAVASATQVDSHFQTTLSITVLSADPNQQFNGVIHWNDVQGDTTVVTGLTPNTIRQVLSPQYLTNPNAKNASAPIPISVTLVPTGVSQAFVVEETAQTVARIPGAGLAEIKIVSTSGGGFVDVILPTVLTVPNQAANQETTLSQSSSAGVASSQSINTDERIVFLRVVSPSDADAPEPILRDSNVKDVPSLMVVSDGKAPSAFKLEDADLNDLPGLFKKLPDGRYQVYLLEEGHLRLVIDVAVRQGRAVDPSGDSGGRDRPPTGQVDGADRDPLVEIKTQYQRAINALKADSPEVPPLDSPLTPDSPKIPPTGPIETTASAERTHIPAVRLERTSNGQAPANQASVACGNADRRTVAFAAAAGSTALAAAGALSRAERIDRAMQELDPRSLTKTARLVRWLKKPNSPKS
jgi:hypothetical protein